MISPVRDAILYRESLLDQEKPSDTLVEQRHHLAQLAKLLARVKEEHKKLESRMGVPLSRILRQEQAPAAS
jgi:hypothetical protein